MKFLYRGMLVCTLLTLLLTGGCRPADEPPPEEDIVEDETVPDEAEPDTETPEEEAAPEGADAQMIAEGEAVVQQSCVSCHGENLEGGMGPSLHGMTEKYTREELYDILVNGIGSMPAGTARGHEEEVIAYLMTLD